MVSAKFFGEVVDILAQLMNLLPVVSLPVPQSLVLVLEFGQSGWGEIVIGGLCRGAGWDVWGRRGLSGVIHAYWV